MTSPVSVREYTIMAILGVAAFIFGVVPVIVFSMTEYTFESLMGVLGVPIK